VLLGGAIGFLARGWAGYGMPFAAAGARPFMQPGPREFFQNGGRMMARGYYGANGLFWIGRLLTGVVWLGGLAGIIALIVVLTQRNRPNRAEKVETVEAETPKTES
jgi:hypothetical protein